MFCISILLYIALNKIVLLKLAGEQHVHEVRYSEVSGEPGATYYGYVRDKKRFMSIEALVTPPVADGIVFPPPPPSSSGFDEVDAAAAAATAAAEQELLDLGEYNLEY